VLPSLRYITNTAAALPPTHIERLQALFPHVRLYSMYGLTECKRVSYLPPHLSDVKPASVGVAIPGTEVWVEDAEGNECAPGEVGELMVRGAHVMQGYWNKPEATAERLRPGRWPWERVLATGDLFRTDEEGYLYFVGRTDDIIKSRGEKVSPKEVEAAVAELSGVREAAVIGVEDELLGQAVKAFVVLEPGTTLNAREVQRHCQARLEGYMVPKHVVFIDDLPRTSNGKVARHELR